MIDVSSEQFLVSSVDFHKSWVHCVLAFLHLILWP